MEDKSLEVEATAAEAPAVDPGGRGGKVKSSTLRALTALAVFVVVGVGLAVSTGFGTPSSFGFDQIAAICPLGALEAFFGTWAFVPRLLIALAVTVVVVLVFGKAFCSWVCPVPHVKNLFSGKKAVAKEEGQRQEAAKFALENWREGRSVERSKAGLDSRHAVLGGALLSTAIFGFPVFCLVCPVGLTFATFILAWRLVQFNDFTWGLLVFPIIILVEVLVLRKWCGRICPLGALISLIARANKTFRPSVDHEKCLRDTGDAGCVACSAACPEQIDPFADLGKRPLDECVKCRSCVDACPAKAITLPLLSAKAGLGGRNEVE